MLEKAGIKERFLLVLISVAWLVVFCIAGCGGGGDGDGGDDDSSSSTSYSELDVSFGGVVLNHYADRTLSLQNAGSVNLSLGQIEDPALPFTIVNDGCSGRTLAPSGTCDVQIRFSPTEEGTWIDWFDVPLSGSDTDFATVSLDGIGHGLNVTINQLSTENCSTIKLIVSVTNDSDDFITGLNESNFTLIEDTEAVGSDTVTPDPSNLSVVLALDSSDSVSDMLPEIRDAAKAFIGDLEDGDEAAIFRFAETAEEEIGFTIVSAGNNDTLNDAIDNITTTSGSTALYSALSQVCDYFDSALHARRAIVIITDGGDTASDMDLEDAIDYAQEDGIPVFTIGLGTDNAEVLQTLADETGGQYYDAPTEDVLDTIYPQIAQLLTNQYGIEYTSNSSGGATVTVNLAVEYNGLTGEDSREFEGCP